MQAIESHRLFTNQKRFTLGDLAIECMEFIHSLSTWNRQKIEDKISDVAVFIRLYLYCNFNYIDNCVTYSSSANAVIELDNCA